MGKTNTAHLEFCTYQNTNQAPTKVNMYCSNSQCNDQIHVIRFTLMPLTEGIKAVKKLLAYRKEDVFLVLIDSSRVWNYVTVLDDRHRLSCKHVHKHVISTSRYSENTVHLHNHILTPWIERYCMMNWDHHRQQDWFRTRRCLLAAYWVYERFFNTYWYGASWL